MKSIRARLLIGLLGGALCCTLIAAFMLYRLAAHEADEQSDLRLLQVAWALPLQLSGAAKIAPEPDFDDVVLAQVWDSKGRSVYISEPSHALPRQLAPGYRTIAARGERWRVYAESRGDYFVQVAQPIAVRKRVAARMALRVLPPLLLLLPALAVMIGVVVGAALRPLERLALAVRGRSASALQPLDTAGLPPELLPMASALNSLLAKIDSALSAQRNFVADAAHELRSPLTALKLQLQLAERAGDDAARAESFRKLHERLDRSTHLVRQLLTLARHEQTQAPPPRLPCDLLALAQTVVSDHAIHAETKGIDLGIAADAASTVAAIHLEGVKVMLNNLVDNALRYTQAGGQVDVAVGSERGRPCLRVSDNGPGVPAAERARLFDRFYRPDGNALWGCGLGMSIVKSVADGHDAEIELSSNAGGVGLVVTVRLPASRW